MEARRRDLLARMSLISYGSVQRFGGRRGVEPERIGPSGEGEPMAELWAFEFDRARTDEDLFWLLEEAEDDLNSWTRRQLAPDTTETLEELCDRIVSDGWGVTANECAMAMRCTPTLVRRARLGANRNPESGHALPEPQADRMAWARALDKVGLSYRQIEALTGLPKSTLHDRLRRVA